MATPTPAPTLTLPQLPAELVLPTALVAALLPLLAYIAYALHALLAAQHAHTASLAAATTALRDLHDAHASTTAAKPNADAGAEREEATRAAAAGVEKEVARTTRAVERVVALLEERERERQRERQPNNNNNDGEQQRNGWTGPSSARSTQEADADLYRRKVEAMEGLRKLMAAQPPTPVTEDAGLYRRRVEALEGLRRVLEVQPGVGLGGRKVSGKVGGGESFGDALSVKSEGRALRKERSVETLGESLLLDL